jgi:hypothetical protein
MYKCDNADDETWWHEHSLTQEDIDWYNYINAFSIINGATNASMKSILGKWNGWYNSVKKAIYYSNKETGYVFMKHHPFTKCCDVHGQKIAYPYPRQPLQLIKEPDQNSAIESRDKAQKSVDTSASTTMSLCKGTSKPPTMPWTQQLKLPHQHQQNDVINGHDHGTWFADENDSLDCNKPHFPLHYQYPSKSIVAKMKARRKKRQRKKRR